VAITGANDVPVSAKILMQTVGIPRSTAFDAMKAVHEMKNSPVRKGTFYGERLLGYRSGQDAADVKRKRADSARKAHREILMGGQAAFVGEPRVFRRFDDVYPATETAVRIMWSQVDQMMAGAERLGDRGIGAREMISGWKSLDDVRAWYGIEVEQPVEVIAGW
jgi:hypothetical protein